MEKLNDNVMAAIKKSLPEATAGVLKEYFDDHENLIEEHDDLKIELESSKIRVDKFRQELEKLKDYENRLAEIEKTEKQLALEMTEFNTQQRVLSVEKKYSESAILEYKEIFNKVFDSIFRNTEIRKSVTKSHVVKNSEMNTGMVDNNGSPIIQDGGERVEYHTDTETTEEK
jgi:predicted nuclease with TOPRIM domain